MSHQMLAIREGPPPATAPRTYLGTRPPAPCKFFQAGRCRSGNSCTFSHDLKQTTTTSSSSSSLLSTTAKPDSASASTSASASAAPRTQPQPSPAVICKFFARGSCRSGDACVFVHPGLLSPMQGFSAAKGTQDGDAVDREPEDKKDDYTRTLAGALVKFTTGANVDSIALASDFSAVRLSGLPRSATTELIREYVASKGFPVTADDVRIQPGMAVHATVRSTDRNFARSACAGMWFWPTGEPLQATPIGTPMPPGHSARRVDYKKLHVSWHKGTKPASLTWLRQSTMSKAGDLYASGKYTVLGQKVTVQRPRSPSLNLLLNVPYTATEEDILEGISAAYHRPATVVFGKPSHTTSPEEACVFVQSLFTAIGPLEYWEMTLESTARRVKATARFLDEADAGRAVKELHDSTLPFFPEGKLTVNLVYSAKFKVSTGVYNAVKTRVLKSAQAWREADNVNFYAYLPSDALMRFRVLKIEAEASDKVVAARGELDTILDGVVPKDKNGEALWDASLRGNGKLFRDIMTIAKENSVIILRNKVRSELRILGTVEQCALAVVELRSLFKKNRKSTARSVVLEGEQLRWAYFGGVKAIMEALGPDKVVFDVVSRPIRVVVSGSLEDFDLAQRMVATQSTTLPNGRAAATNATTTDDCSVCWCPPDSPVRTPCGHIYCGECFETSCLSAPATEAGLQVACHGEASTCNTIIPLSFIQENLPSAVFEDILDKSFNNYVQRHMDTLRFCPTPRCGHIYRLTQNTQEPIARTCSGCFARSCSGCGSAEMHPGYSCGEWRAAKAGTDEGTKRLRQKLGIKDCPKCGVGIEKTDGCNHMTCQACKCHMCWVCMKTFRVGNDVYVHMADAHGGHTTIA